MTEKINLLIIKFKSKVIKALKSTFYKYFKNINS